MHTPGMSESASESRGCPPGLQSGLHDLRRTGLPTGYALGHMAKRAAGTSSPLVGIIMGSRSDWGTMEHAARMLIQLQVPHEVRVISAHRTPDLLFAYASAAAGRGIEVIIAGAGGAAHLPGMCAAKTALPVLGVPVESKALRGVDSLLSILQMPAGIPVGTLAIGKPGAINAGLLAAAILGGKHPKFRAAVAEFRAAQTLSVQIGRAHV